MSLNGTYLIRRTDVQVDGGHAVPDGGPGVEPLQPGDVHRVDRVRHVLVVIVREPRRRVQLRAVTSHGDIDGTGRCQQGQYHNENCLHIPVNKYSDYIELYIYEIELKRSFFYKRVW